MNQEELKKLIARLRTYAKVDTMSSEIAAQRHICWIAADALEEMEVNCKPLKENSNE